MNTKVKRKIPLYEYNSDFNGKRAITEKHEFVDYQKDSTIRIWYNDQTEGFDAHWHTALEIILPRENYYDAECCGTHYHLLPGDILLIPSGEMHQIFAPPNGNRFIFLFDISLLSKLQGFSGLQPFLMQPILITKEHKPNIYSEEYELLQKMIDEYFSENEFRELSIYSLLLDFLINYAKDARADESTFPNARIYKQKEYMQKFNEVLHYIEHNYADDLTLEKVAAYAGFSKFYFTRLFKQYTNSTFNDYLVSQRIKAAERLLAKPDSSITEIALQSGFTSISSFNRTFRNFKRCTPSEYRNLCCRLE